MQKYIPGHFLVIFESTEQTQFIIISYPVLSCGSLGSCIQNTKGLSVGQYPSEEAA